MSVTEEVTRVIALAQKIDAKCDRILDPLDREMRQMAWDAEYQRIIWETIMHKINTRLARLPI